MWKMLMAMAAASALIGCSNDNQISLVNNAQTGIMFNFRAAETNVASGASVAIKDIPNGSYTYATTYGVPAGSTSWSVSGDAGAGSLTFSKKQTHQLLIFSSTLADGAYTLYVNATSSEPTGGAAKVIAPR